MAAQGLTTLAALTEAQCPGCGREDAVGEAMADLARKARGMTSNVDPPHSNSGLIKSEHTDLEAIKARHVKSQWSDHCAVCGEWEPGDGIYDVVPWPCDAARLAETNAKAHIVNSGLMRDLAAAEADADALRRLTPTEGHVVIFIDPGPRYRTVIYDPEGEWNEDEYDSYDTLPEAVSAAFAAHDARRP